MAEVVVERDIAAPPEVVFEMFTDPELLIRWLGDSAELEPFPGGLFRFTLGDEDACRGRYVEVDPPHRVVFTWGWERAEAIPVPAGSTVVEVDLTPIAAGTHLMLTHHGLDGEAADLHTHGWQRFLTRMAAVIDDTDAGPDPWRDHPDQIRQEL